MFNFAYLSLNCCSVWSDWLFFFSKFDYDQFDRFKMMLIVCVKCTSSKTSPMLCWYPCCDLEFQLFLNSSSRKKRPPGLVKRIFWFHCNFISIHFLLIILASTKNQKVRVQVVCEVISEHQKNKAKVIVREFSSRGHLFFMYTPIELRKIKLPKKELDVCFILDVQHNLGVFG